jgi:hypothetical protein
MKYILSIIGMILSVYMIIKREAVGDMLGQPEWSVKIGGAYNMVVLIAGFIFFWSLATITGTSDVLFGPVISFFSFSSLKTENPNIIQ